MSYLAGGTGPGKAFSIFGFGAMFMPLDGYGVSAVLGSGVAVEDTEELLETSSGRNFMLALLNVFSFECSLCHEGEGTSVEVLLVHSNGGQQMAQGGRREHVRSDL